MDFRKLDIPVRKWVSPEAGIVSVFIIVLPVLLLNGSYTGSMLEVSGTLGTCSEDIMMGYYAASAGMAIAYPIVPAVLDTMSSKMLLSADLILQILLSWICATMQSPAILILCSFIIGFLKGFIMLWFIRRASKIFSPRNVRSEFYSYFYPLVYGAGQISMVITARIAYLFDWKYMYYLMMILLLIALLTVIILYRNDRPARRISPERLHIREMAVASAAVLMFLYALIYGKISDWFSSDIITFCMIASPLLAIYFLNHEYRSEKPYVSLEPLFRIKTLAGYAFMMAAMFLSSSTSIMTAYTGSILHLDTVRSYAVYIWMIPGYALSAFVCFWWFRWQRWRFRYLIAGGMACFAAYFSIMYFTVSPSSTYESLFLPVFLRGAGMLAIIIAFALYAVEGMNPKNLIHNAFFVIIARSVLAPAAAYAVYSESLYRLQLKYFSILSENMTRTDYLAWNRYSEAFEKNLGSGQTQFDAAKGAVSALDGILQQQSTLLALKDIYGWMMAITLVTAAACAFIPFHRTLKVRFAKAGDDMV